MKSRSFPPRVLVLDDEKNITLVIEAILQKEGIEVETCTDSQTGLQLLSLQKFDAVITDLYMPEVDGFQILAQSLKNDPTLPVVMITAFGSVEAAVSALKKGAFDFITKPFDQDELVNSVLKAIRTKLDADRKEPTLVYGLGPEQASLLLGSSPSMQHVLRLIKKVASSNSPVLILGERGTGKELVASEIHRESLRREKSFIKMNCAAIPASMLEGELFGYERGAFPGAVASKPGRFELADQGTLFLDEVTDLTLEVQIKLTRAIQDGRFERAGGVEEHISDVRIITATQKNLAAEVQAGRFREDLYYLLNIVPLELPPLRERAEDLDSLVEAYIQRFNSKLKRHVTGINHECLKILKSYSWPGNLRQLENTIERMVLIAEGSILTTKDLPPEMSQTDALVEEDDGFKEAVKRQTQKVERSLIERALKQTAGNVTRAAAKLRLSRKGLQLKMKELGLRRAPDSEPEVQESDSTLS